MASISYACKCSDMPCITTFTSRILKLMAKEAECAWRLVLEMRLVSFCLRSTCRQSVPVCSSKSSLKHGLFPDAYSFPRLCNNNTVWVRGPHPLPLLSSTDQDQAKFQLIAASASPCLPGARWEQPCAYVSLSNLTPVC